MRLVSFAIHWIKAEIHEYILKNWRLVKVATTGPAQAFLQPAQPEERLRRRRHPFRHPGRRSRPTARRQAGRGGRDETRMSGRDLALEGNPEDGEEAFAPIDYLADSRYEPTRVIEGKAIAHLQDQGLATALGSLDPRSRRIVEARWLHDGEAATLHDLADEFGVSAERIRQIETKPCRK